MTPNRRTVLEFTGAIGLATTAAVGPADWLAADAAAQEDETDNEDDTDAYPEYSRWLTLEDDALEFVFVDWTAVGDEIQAELEGEVTEPAEEVPPEFEADPMVAPLSEALLSAYFYVALDLAQYRLGRILEAETFDSTVEDLLLTDRVFVATGEIDPDEIDAQVTAEADAEFLQQLERTDEIGAYDIYTPVDPEADVAVAVGTDAILVAEAVPAADDPLTALESAIQAADGETERATDDSETLAWLLEQEADGNNNGGVDVAVGQYGDPTDGLVDIDFEYDELEGAEGISSSFTVEDEETATGDFAAVIDDPDEAALEAVLGASGEDRSLEIDGDRVIATAIWREDLAIN
ncbi:uncharacterized protein Nmag_1242 [Natrialba magadii ATCC 43099]|uniref:Uncharacterized protein n=1 Tax=Natrialba magadii (strain ATCC 43099 / DSM 3394 / CCM 3739 / CIP 104546 / IAM 13178 / JCM 8861 / NBRC 102185 / NCIMB 2190 / MS3) TaxID=547559 RepID=D3SS98_NATMM|nr:hypothetical protein [Natrialba magadii]ADD04824.1 uncharacterized protein Nmag_1242 [Natrialba magadii ATCC 43099]ELY24490.1 hypothetical protein C500_18720 [Natrialba magadii ATCC 43099]